MFACSYGAAFGAIQHVPRIVPGLAEVSALPRRDQQKVVSAVQAFQEFGGLAGRVVLAFLAVRIVAPRAAPARLPGPGPVPPAHRLPLARHDQPRAAQVGHLPRRAPDRRPVQLLGKLPARASIPTHLRGTGESFAANVGGRMIGTSAALLTTTLATVDAGRERPRSSSPRRRRSWASPSTPSASPRASRCPNPRATPCRNRGGFALALVCEGG